MISRIQYLHRRLSVAKYTKSLNYVSFIDCCGLEITGVLEVLFEFDAMYNRSNNYNNGKVLR